MKYQDNQHFSHNHILNPLHFDQGDNITCKACDQNITDPTFHGCIKCSHYLHDSCLNTPRSLIHSSHPSHPLTLHSTPTYPSYSFTCDACHSLGNKFSLSCAHCDYDLHIQCANSPDSIVVVEKHPHEMKLKFRSLYDDKTTPFKCGLCAVVMNPDEWLYICETCDFRSHLECINGKPRMKQMPNENSIPTPSAQQPAYYQQPQQTPYYNNMYPGAQYPQPQMPNAYTTNQVPGSQYTQPQMPNMYTTNQVPGPQYSRPQMPNVNTTNYPQHQMPNANTSNQVPGAQYPPHLRPNANNINQAHQQAMQDMAAVNEAQEELDAAYAYNRIQAQSRRAILDLI